MREPASPPGLGRRLVAALWCAVAAPYVVLAAVVPLARARGGLAPWMAPTLGPLAVVGALALVAYVPRVSAALPEDLDRWLARERRAGAALWGLGAVVAVYQFTKIAVFLGDPGLVGSSLAPDDPFLVRHSCLTAYVHGAILSRVPGANVYDLAYVHDDPAASHALPPTAAGFAPFTLDAYGYPPPFLLLPRALLALTSSFVSLRLLFGAASLVALLVACAAMADTLAGTARRRAWLLAPLMLCNPPVLATLQVGNFHLAAVALCLGCWVALARDRHRVAGTLLAVATLAKIFPGLLGVVLVARARWRAVASAALVAAALCAVSVAVLGVGVWRDFLVYHLPHVDSGEALRFMASSSREVTFNVAPFGIPFKLRALGLAGWSWPEARAIGRAYTVVLLALALAAARNRGSLRHELSVWLAVVMLASLRSPYAAPFVLSTVCVLLTVLASEVRSPRGVASMVVAWAVVTLPSPAGDPSLGVALSLGRVLTLYAFLAWAALRPEARGEGDDARDVASRRGIDVDHERVEEIVA